MSDMHTQPDDSVQEPKDSGAEIKQELEAWQANKEKASESPPEAVQLEQLKPSPQPYPVPLKQAELGVKQVDMQPSMTVAEILVTSSLEFRDALQNIQGFLELLLSDKVPDERQAMLFLDIVYRESQYLNHRVSDLQIASLIETGKLRVKLTALAIDQLIRSTVEESTPVAGEKGIQIEVISPTDLPPLQGDEVLLHQMFTNLLDTTLKGTPRDGQVSIIVAHNDTSLLVQVVGGRDGETFDAASLTVADETDSNSVTTMGLGLYVADQIVKAHDGRISITSVQGGTRVFNLALPLQPKSLRRGKILIVEDNPHLALLIEFALEKEGFEVFKAANGLKALEIAKSEGIDLVILDIMLPGIDGFEVCHRLRSAPDTASARVIMVSAKARDEDRATALRVGADAYFQKPLGMTELTAAVEDLLDEKQDDYRRKPNG